MPTTTASLDRHRRQVDTPVGPASCIDTGGPGRAALFVHGLATGAHLWRNVIGQLDERRCVAVDLPIHGQTPVAPGQDLSLPGLARFLLGCCDALELPEVDLVANDTSGAIAQVFAAEHPDRLHTLTLTNCEAHDNVPPRGLRIAHRLARADQASGVGLLARLGPRLGRTPEARRRFYRTGYEDPASLPDEIARGWLQPLFATRTAAREYTRMFASIRARDLLAVEPALQGLEVPTLIVWGNGDRFFEPKWAHWLHHTIPELKAFGQRGHAFDSHVDAPAGSLYPTVPIRRDHLSESLAQQQCHRLMAEVRLNPSEIKRDCCLLSQLVEAILGLISNELGQRLKGQTRN